MRTDYTEKKRKQKKMITIAVFVGMLALIIYFKSKPMEKDTGKGNEITKKNSANKPREVFHHEEIARLKNKVKDLPTIVAETKKGIVSIETFDSTGNKLGSGTGFFINKTGRFISNRHVFKGADRAEIKIHNGKRFPVENVLAEDEDNDLILLKVNVRSDYITALVVGDKLPRVGESIVVIGNPLGLESTVSSGIVSANRELEPFDKVIQITSPISPGSSGSPVLNLKGKVIGIATFQLVAGQNLNFAIPSTTFEALTSDTSNVLTLNDLEFGGPVDIDEESSNFEKGQAYFEGKSYRNAVSAFKKALQDSDKKADVYFHLGNSYMQMGSLLQAVDSFKSAVNNDPAYSDAYTQLGIAYSMLNMNREAAGILREGLDINGDDTEALLFLGISYARLKEYRAAVKILEKAVENEVGADAYYYLGLSYASVNKTGKAIAALRDAISMDSEYEEPHVALGYIYLEVKNYSQGIKQLNKAVFTFPNSPYIHFLLGIMHLGKDNISSSEYHYEVLKKLEVHKEKKQEVIKLQRTLSEAISMFRSRRRRP
ncbi:MAG: tetratricopeptide repeat protein [bacterium]|nr:tetratricopeptide repeat protein [bacterium]